VEILFTRSSGLLSGVIRLVDGGRASHVGLAFDSRDFAVSLVLDAGLAGVALTPRSRWLQGRRIVSAFRPVATAEEDRLRQGLARAAEDLGRRYDFVGLLGFAWIRLMFRWLSRKVRNPMASPRRLVCSELVAEALKGAGFILTPETSTPQTLIEWLRTSDHFAREL